MRSPTGLLAPKKGPLSYLAAYLVVYVVFAIAYRLVSGEWSWLAPLGWLAATEVFRLTAHIITSVISPAPGAPARPVPDAPTSQSETDRPS
jgi:hypothetical protein